MSLVKREAPHDSAQRWSSVDPVSRRWVPAFAGMTTSPHELSQILFRSFPKSHPHRRTTLYGKPGKTGFPSLNQAHRFAMHRESTSARTPVSLRAPPVAAFD